MMDQSPISYRWIFFLSIFFLIITLSIYASSLLAPNKAKVVFCDVGQGDGAYVRTSTGTDIVIDAGPDNSILTCLGRSMPSFDKNIEYAFLSHPQHDHYAGFLGILKNYHISHFYISSGDNVAKSYSQLKALLKTTHTDVKVIHGLTQLNPDVSSHIDFFWPTPEFKSNNLNDYSQIFILTLNGTHRFLFTGDTSPLVLSIIGKLYTSAFSYISVLKVPHHGSKNGLTLDFLKLADPTISVISVALKNRYHHPSLEVLDYFKALQKKYLTTSKYGDITITVDGGELVVYSRNGLIVQ